MDRKLAIGILVRKQTTLIRDLLKRKRGGEPVPELKGAIQHLHALGEAWGCEKKKP